MFCGTCGSLLPDGMVVCRNCGSMNAPQRSGPQLGSSPDRADGQGAPYQYTPPTQYGGGQNPYGAPPPPPPPYNMNPYDATMAAPYAPTPMPPQSALPPTLPAQPLMPMPMHQLPPRKRSNKLLIIIGGILVACLVLCGALVYSTSIIANSGSGSQRAGATATASASPAGDQNPYPPQTGTLIMNDPMHDNSKGYKWDEATINGKNGNGFCGYKQGNYHITESGVPATSQATVICNPEAPQFSLSNLAFEANIVISKGAAVGLAMRFDQTKGIGYIFKVFTNGQYAIGKADLNNVVAERQFVPLRTGTNGAIKQGLNQNNLLAIVANGNTLSLFMNGQFIDGVQDSSFMNGQLGLCAFSSGGDLDAVAQNVRVWRI